jgi:hypothetical protein
MQLPMTTFPPSAPSAESGKSDIHNVHILEIERERDQPAYLPTLEEIAAACAEIRAGWSMEERCRRGIGPRRQF